MDGYIYPGDREKENALGIEDGPSRNTSNVQTIMKEELI